MIQPGDTSDAGGGRLFNGIEKRDIAAPRMGS